MNRQRGLLLAILGIAIAIIGILVVFQLIQDATQPDALPTPIPPITESVLVTTHDIPVQTIIRSGDLTVVQVPVELASANALNNLETAVGKLTSVPLVSGEILMVHHLVDPTNVQGNYGFVLEDDQVLMAFPAPDLMSQINILQPGDLVDILVSIQQPVLPGQVGFTNATGEEERPDEVLFTFDALQRIEISAVIVEIAAARVTSSSSASGSGSNTDDEGNPLPTPTPSPSQIEPQAILMALSPQDALVLRHLKDAGGQIDIVLRAPGSTEVFELNPVMPEYLRDRYDLVITK